jgi:cell division protein FtsI/penicillin-binding protein 2
MRIAARVVAIPLLTALVMAAGEASAASKRSKRRKIQLPTVPAVLLAPTASDRDRAVAEACKRGLRGASGAVVAMDPHTGRVMAVVNPQQGLLQAFQPCSVFKIVVAIAGLTEGVITPETAYTCSRGCWMWAGHGPIDLRRALAVSCNPYFEWIGEQLGYEKIQRYAHLLGLGAPSGINLTVEKPGKIRETAGRVPNSVRPALVGHLSSHAAGITTSAVQIAVLLSATINGGVVFQPQISGLDGFESKERWRLPPGTVLEGLREGFLGAVNEGSASSAFDPDVIVAGKTGSCSSVGWFASYAPYDQPEIVVVVFVRRGNGHLASAIASRIYQELYKTPASSQSIAGE